MWVYQGGGGCNTKVATFDILRTVIMILFLVQNHGTSTCLDINGSLMGTPILSNDTMAAEWKH